MNTFANFEILKRVIIAKHLGSSVFLGTICCFGGKNEWLLGGSLIRKAFCEPKRGGLKISYACERVFYQKCVSWNLLKLYLIKIFHAEDMLSFIEDHLIVW